ncbi:RNA polymerase II transcriptional coactivator KELP [Prosopis cineraria]|uniref:RNA polymerase II transcriptional coactivator KELP n=1 Tax=Prosopis cineraria TaxID=364024 RepID=UPI0024105105|nr:RNA polymerase II transcriptional coactivator KELP [Prosopis cineraria]
MDAEIKGRIETTVRRILQESDMDELTESQIRKQAAKELDLDLSQPHYKTFVKQIVQSFIQEKQEEQEDEEYDDEGNLIICKLSAQRRVTIQEFRGKTLISIREYYRKDGKELPSSKGISLTEEQWSALKKNIPAIEKAIEKMESNI